MLLCGVVVNIQGDEPSEGWTDPGAAHTWRSPWWQHVRGLSTGCIFSKHGRCHSTQATFLAVASVYYVGLTLTQESLKN